MVGNRRQGRSEDTAWQAMLDQLLQYACPYQMLEESVRPIPAACVERLGVVYHHPEERAREGLNDCLLVDGEIVDGGSDIAAL